MQAKERRLAMLVLSRRVGERIVFPGVNASVKILAVNRGSIRLGIEAPQVVVLREELRDTQEPESLDAGPASLSGE
jgi:carbon storage regulator CsrA